MENPFETNFTALYKEKPTLTVRRKGHRWIHGLMFLLSAFCSTTLLKTLIWGAFNSDINLTETFVFTLLFLVFAPFAVYSFRMSVKNRFIFTISPLGIEQKDRLLSDWNSLYEIHMNKIPGKGLEFLYYLVAPKGLFFFRIVLFHDYELKRKTKLVISSDINTSFDAIEDAIIFYAVKYNIVVR